jgi:hypothetical protein
LRAAATWVLLRPVARLIAAPDTFNSNSFAMAWGFLGGGQAVADEAGDGHGAGGVPRGGEVGADDAGQRQTGGVGGGLATVSVDGDVGDLRVEVVAGNQVDRDDDERDEDADLGHRGGEFLDSAAGVAEVVRVLGDLLGQQFDHDNRCGFAHLGCWMVGAVSGGDS